MAAIEAPQRVPVSVSEGVLLRYLGLNLMYFNKALSFTKNPPEGIGVKRVLWGSEVIVNTFSQRKPGKMREFIKGRINPP